jgi:hypothetical protein
VRGFIETMIEEELTGALSRPRYARQRVGAEGAGTAGHRHGHRTRRLTGTFGPTEMVVPRARLVGADGSRSEWKSSELRAYQRRTLAADALIASTYLAGANTIRDGTPGCESPPLRWSRRRLSLALASVGERRSANRNRLSLLRYRKGGAEGWAA